MTETRQLAIMWKSGQPAQIIEVRKATETERENLAEWAQDKMHYTSGPGEVLEHIDKNDIDGTATGILTSGSIWYITTGQADDYRELNAQRQVVVDAQRAEDQVEAERFDRLVAPHINEDGTFGEY